MAHHKSCIKRIRTSKEANERNRQYRTQIRNAIKKLRAMSSKDEAQLYYRQVTGMLDKLVVKNIIKKNAAANRKSALANFVNSL
jgi:small subunit ribosomal protein S20